MKATSTGAAMRTRSEIEAAAIRLEREAGGVSQETSREARILFRFPESTVTLGTAINADGGFLHRIFRHIAFKQSASGPKYTLVEEESVADSMGRLLRVYEPVAIFTGDRAGDALTAGYMRVDEDRLLNSIEPITTRISANGFTLEEWEDALLKIQELTKSLDLSTASRLRMKSDACDLLEGRLELGDFVARTIARRNCFQRNQCVMESRQITESSGIQA